MRLGSLGVVLAGAALGAAGRQRRRRTFRRRSIRSRCPGPGRHDLGRLQADPRHELGRSDARASSAQLRVALVAIDFDDQPFVITRPKQSDPFGNPQIDPITREAVPQFYADFISMPSALNHGHTIHHYWMELSRGKVGVPIDAFGPYRMPRKLFEYGLNEYNQNGSAWTGGCPTGLPATAGWTTSRALWTADAGANIAIHYDRVLRIYAGYDETSVWQEFGEMKFNTKEDIPERGAIRTRPSRDGSRPLCPVDLLAGRRAAVGAVVHSSGRELGHHHARDGTRRQASATTTTIPT